VSLVVIAVLAIIWVLALTPMMLRKLSEHRFTTSVDSFHRQLRGMRRAYPRLAASAAEPEMMLSVAEPADDGGQMPYLQPAPVSRPQTVARSAHPGVQAAARRRRVLLVLVGSILGLFLLGIIPALRVFWGLSLLVVATTAGYLAVLIHIHRGSVERRAKVVDIRDLRSEAEAVPPARTHAIVIASSHRRIAEQLEWDEDELLEPAFDYDFDESIAGGR